MTEEMRKRLEEAADKYADDVATTEERGWMDRSDIYAIAKDAHLAGAELGYKEAIAQAKEWLKKQGKDWWEGYGLPFSIADFETDMNKLWEEKK